MGGDPAFQNELDVSYAISASRIIFERSFHFSDFRFSAKSNCPVVLLLVFFFSFFFFFFFFIISFSSNITLRMHNSCL